MKEDIYDDLFEEKEEKTDFHVLFKYIIRWHWFAASVIICLAAAWLYLKYTTPVYNISASVIIKDDKKGGAAGSNFSAFEDLGIISSSNNIDNEIEILHSKSLIKDVVCELGLYINYSTTGGFNTTDLYGSSPILIHFPPEDADRLTDPILLTINYHAGGQTDVTATINETVLNRHFTKLPAVISGEAGTLTLMPNPAIPIEGSGSIEVSIVKPFTLAKGYRSALSIEPTSKTTSVATISINDTHTKRGEDFINKLVEMYNRDTNDDKNEVAENTAHFIDERISVIDQELGTTERELESFKREAGLTDLSSDAKLAVSERSEYEKLCVENGTQLNLIQYLSDYLDKPESSYTTLPANVGLNDNTLTGLITQYNALILERNRLLRTSCHHHYQRAQRTAYHQIRPRPRGRQIRRTHQQCSCTGTPFRQHPAPAGNQGGPLSHAAAKTRREQYRPCSHCQQCQNHIPQREAHLPDCPRARLRYSGCHYLRPESAQFPHRRTQRRRKAHYRPHNR